MGTREVFFQSLDHFRNLFPDDAEQWFVSLRQLPALEGLVLRLFELFERQNKEIDAACSGFIRPLTLEERERLWIESGGPNRFFANPENGFPDVDTDSLFAAWTEFHTLLMFVCHGAYVAKSVGHRPTGAELMDKRWGGWSWCDRLRERYAPILGQIMQ